MMPIRGVLLDLDGTLVDSNDAHAHAWQEALIENGYHVPYDKIRRCIGMGGDKLLKEVASLDKDSPIAEKVDARYSEIFISKYLPHLKPFPGVRPLIERMHRDGLILVVASSGKKVELKAMLKIADITDLIDGATSSSDVEHSKPDPDILNVALHKGKLTGAESVMLADTPYDIWAAERVGVHCIMFRCGGWQDRDLKGALEIYDGPADLLAKYDESALTRTRVAHR